MSVARSCLKWGVRGLLGLILLGFGVWWLTGGRWYIMSTASMSPHLPVGTLVFTRPLTGPPQVGGIYAFIPPGQDVTFIHRVVSRDSASGFHTEGYLNRSVDPWTITKADLRARAVAWFSGMGWALMSLPIWVGLATLWWLANRLVDRERSQWFGGVAIGLAVAIPVLLWHFLVNGKLVASVAARGLLHLYLVSAGILPSSVSIRGRYLGILPPGDAKVVSLPAHHLGPIVIVDLHAALPWWGWATVILMCAIPLLRGVWLSASVR